MTRVFSNLTSLHAFVDGNKRTAWAAAWTFLHLNGVGLAVDFDVDDAEAFMNQVATDAVTASRDARRAPRVAAFRQAVPAASR